MAETAIQTGPNAVVHVFSKVPRTREEWQAFANEAMNSFETVLAEDSNPVDRSEVNSGEVQARIWEARQRIEPPAADGILTLEDCRQTRQSDVVGAFEQSREAEVVIQPINLYLKHREPGLIVFDMDSTLIQQEVVDEISRVVGRYDEVAAVTEAAMRGEMDFVQSLHQRVAALRGVSTDIWEKMKRDVITFSPGARELIAVLKHLGWKTVVVSGGFTQLAFWLRDTLGLDYAYANELLVDLDTQTLTGELLPGAPIVGPEAKRDHLIRVAEEHRIPLDRTIAVGDGSNDLLMIGAAGLGIAFNAKPKVQRAAPARLNTESLLDIMYLLGYNKTEIDAALAASPVPSGEAYGSREPHVSSIHSLLN